MHGIWKWLTLLNLLNTRNVKKHEYQTFEGYLSVHIKLINVNIKYSNKMKSQTSKLCFYFWKQLISAWVKFFLFFWLFFLINDLSLYNKIKTNHKMYVSIYRSMNTSICFHQMYKSLCFVLTAMHVLIKFDSLFV